MTFAFRRGAIAALVSLVAACGDSPVDCPEGMLLEGMNCNLVDGGVPLTGDAGPGPDVSAPGDGGAVCTPSSELDLPDREFVDENCDGFDGDLSAAVAVVPAGDIAPPGVAATAETLGEAVAMAQSQNLMQVWVAVGEWSGPLELVAGISIYGGYEPENDWARTRASKTRVTGAGPVLVGEDIANPTEVALIDFEADDAPDEGTSIAARIVRSTGVRLEEVLLEAGRGGDGMDGGRPEPTASGGPGADGGITGVGTQCVTTFRSRPMGGDGGGGCRECYEGGRGGTTSGSNTSVGSTSGGGSGFDGTKRTIGSARVCWPGGPDIGGLAPGGDGLPGADGRPGNDGFGGNEGVFSMVEFTPGNGRRGLEGDHGQGGGGGGSAADVRNTGNDFCIYFGASGGGGGGGGCGGTGGPGGTGGGASVALWLWDSTVTLVSVTLAPNDGGDGGRGGLGGDGGEGGEGGRGGAAGSGETRYPDPVSMIGAGGRGADGGSGGEGGGGGGGSGGPSIGILFGGDSQEGLTSTGIAFEVGDGGSAGPGGGFDNDGAVGAVHERFDPEG